MVPPQYFVYVLISQKDSKFYIGLTKDLKQRLIKHQKGQVSSIKSRRLLKLVFVEVFLNKFDALKREIFKKHKRQADAAKYAQGIL